MSKLKPGSQIGPFPYRIVRQLGADSSNLSDVYLVTIGDPTAQVTASQVVVKISKSQDERKEFSEDTIYNEAEQLRKLDHRGIVRILPVQTEHRMRAQPYRAHASHLPGNPWFLVLEYLSGDSLAALLEAHKQLDVPLALEIVRKIAQTLEYLHYNDLVHLDIKPENILFRRPVEVGGRIEPVLIDFGIARNTGQAGLEGRTLHYAPPERILHNRGNAPPETLPLPPPAPSMDIYSLGVVFYQMLAGRRPFEGRTARSISTAIMEGKPTRPSKYSARIGQTLDGLVMQMLHRDPNQRPTAGELVRRLAELRAQPVESSLASSSTGAPQIGALRRRNLLAWVGKAVAVLGALLLIVILGSALIDYRQTGQVRLPTRTTLQAVPVAIGQYVQNLSVRAFSGDFTPVAESSAATTAPPPPLSTQEIAAGGGNEPSPTLDLTATAAVLPATPTTPPSPAPTATDTLTPTPKPPPSTAVPDNPTNTATATSAPSSTPAPTRKPTATPTKKPPISISTPVPENTVGPVVRDAPPVYTPATDKAQTPTPVPPRPVNRLVTLIEPADGAQGNSRVRFSWKSNFTLAPGEAYEFIVWLRNQEPEVSGLGYAGTTTGLSVEIDLLDYTEPEAYRWGVLLVKTEPYKRIQYLGGGWTYFLKSR